MTKEKLQACKCGCKDIELVERQGTYYTTVGFKCKKCGRETLQHYILEEAIFDWNLDYINECIRDSYRKYRGTL